MLESAEKLTAEEIVAIQTDDELRETYEVAVLLKSTVQTEKSYDVEQEWQAFRPCIEQPRLTLHPWSHLCRWAAVLLVLVSVGALAATITYSIINYLPAEEKVAEASKPAAKPATQPKTSQPAVQKEARTEKRISFENITLAEIAKQVEEIYGCEVRIKDAELASLRLYLTLPAGADVAAFVRLIDAYESLSASMSKGVITIKKREGRR